MGSKQRRRESLNRSTDAIATNTSPDTSQTFPSQIQNVSSKVPHEQKGNEANLPQAPATYVSIGVCNIEQNVVWATQNVVWSTQVQLKTGMQL